MQIYEIFMNELNVNVKYKVYTPSESKELVEKLESLKSSDKKKKYVLEQVIYNLNTEVSSSLAMMSRIAAEKTLEALYSACVMLNPLLDVDYWLSIAYMTSTTLDDILDGTGQQSDDEDIEDDDFTVMLHKRLEDKLAKKISKSKNQTKQVKKISKQKFLGLEYYLKKNVVGQDEAIDELVSALARSQAGLNDSNRPLGVFLFAGASGVGKSFLAKSLHTYLFGDAHQMVRVDCGEFQHKHENQKLLGSPNGYIGYEDGGQLTNQMKNNPNSVILLDEVEKAHPDLWNTFLNVFDEGMITDNKGEKIDFRNSIIIMTTNLGNEKTVENLLYKGAGFTGSVDFEKSVKKLPSKELVEKNTFEAIRKYFKPELVNRIDKTIVFNHLSRKDWEKIAEQELSTVAEKLSKRGMSIYYTQNVLDRFIDLGTDTIKGARGMAQVRRDNIETSIAKEIVYKTLPRGTMFHIDYLEDSFILNVEKPVKKSLTK
jgi:ATP-dependent Clp protease ATP-binding subunit ClpA